VGAVVLGVGAGVLIALRDKGTVANPPITSAPPATFAPSPVTTPSASPTPTPTPTVAVPQSAALDGEVIVWPRARNGNWDIALLNLKNGRETRLTKSSREDTFPVLSRDRRSIIYTRVNGDERTLRVMAANGENDRILFRQLPEGCQQLSRPAWGPDNQLAVGCTASSDPKLTLLMLLTLDGKVIRQLDQGRMDDPTFTRDGRSIVYWQNNEGTQDGGALFLVATDGKSDPVRLTKGGSEGEDADPVVSPDGKQIAFRRLTPGFRVLMTARFDGTRLTSKPRERTDGQNDQDPSWSPDGRRLAYKQGPNRNADLRVLDLESGDSTVVVDSSDPETAPAWTAR
jgi:Tol biopolymer transport system component